RRAAGNPELGGAQIGGRGRRWGVLGWGRAGLRGGDEEALLRRPAARDASAQILRRLELLRPPAGSRSPPALVICERGRHRTDRTAMESDLGKLFIGGISWDTNEERLKEYFSNYGEVLEAVIMKDRTTGRARGFGFVVFADPAVAERVVMEKHTIDGRMVEAKKAVPRQDQHILSRNSSPVHGSPSPARTKKIFVGGLASTVTENDFRKYFERFGTITDVVVMYDHNTQRPRGFGFITYDSEDAVDKVLVKTFHELNGKMVEVKRAVPKELSPGPSMRSPIGGGYGYNLSRINSFLNGYAQGYNPSSVSGYGMRMDARFGPITSGRGRFLPFSPAGYGMGMNFEPGLNASYGGNTNENSSLGYGRGMNHFFNGNPSKFSSPIDYGGSNAAGSVLNSTTRNMWGNGGLNYGTSSASDNTFLGSGSVSLGGFGSSSVNWGVSNSPVSAQGGRTGPGYTSMSLSDSSGENGFGLGGNTYARRSSTGTGTNTSFNGSSGGYDGAYADLYSGSSIYGDPTWRSSPLELVGSGPSGYSLGNATSDVTSKGSDGYMGGYNVRQ
ncbi:hypothetical protein Taro_027450, partial [Colocasia esculenta]|nr:hypothetical protein [Colocasia esculenta]